MSDAHKNFAYGVVLTPPSPATTGTTLVLGTGVGALMPIPPFNGVVWPIAIQPSHLNAEIVRVTAVVGDTLTITRGQEGTSPRSIIAGDQFSAAITAKTLTDVETGIAGALIAANNLSDVAAVTTARTNLGLGNAAVANIDATAGDFQMNGAAAAGSTGKVADAGHVHPTDTSRVATSQLGAASGVATLDSSSVNAQTPKAHAQGLHGRSGTDTMLNGLEISDTSTQQTNHTFIFGPRTTTALTYPVATIQPKTSALTVSLDLAPSSGAAEVTNNGQAWIDVCSAPVIDAGTFNANTLRLSVRGTQASPTNAEISTRKFGTNSGVSLYLAADYSGSGDPQIYLTPQTATNPNVLLGYDGSDVFVGPHTAPATNAVRGGYLYLSTCAGAPTGVPAQISSVWSALRYDSTNHKIWVYDNVGAAWKGVALS